jgi:hypothetical protein
MKRARTSDDSSYMRGARTHVRRALLQVGSTTLLVRATGGHARAQAASGDFSVQRFEAAIGPRNFASVAGARTDGHWAWSSGLVFDYSRKPFVLRQCASATDCTGSDGRDVAVVRDLLTWSVLASITPTPRLQFGMRLPIVVTRGEPGALSGSAPGATADDGVDTSAGVGDMALEVKVRVLGTPADTVAVAAIGHIAPPLGRLSARGKFVGNEPPLSAGFGGILDIRRGAVAAAINVGGLYRGTVDVGASKVGSELRWGAALSYDFSSSFGLYAEGFGATRFDTKSGNNPLEAAGGMKIQLADGLTMRLGGGAGVVQAIGVPVARGLVGLRYVAAGAEPEDDEKPATRKKAGR